MVGPYFYKRYILLAARLAPLVAAVEEAAARRRIDGAGNIAFQYDPLPVNINTWCGDCGEKRLSIGMQRVFKQFLRVGQFHNLSQIHDSHPVADVLDDA